MLPRALERVAAGDPGDPQPEEGASWAGHFTDDDYARIDWSHTARQIHNQVRAWHLTFGMSGLRAPVAELDGEEVVLLQTRLTDPGGDARRVDCGDGPIWVVKHEPVRQREAGEIYLMNPDGSGQKRLTGRSGDASASVFSPDGTLIAFTRVSATIWSMKADGTKLRELTAGIDASPRPARRSRQPRRDAGSARRPRATRPLLRLS